MPTNTAKLIIVLLDFKELLDQSIFVFSRLRIDFRLIVVFKTQYSSYGNSSYGKSKRKVFQGKINPIFLQSIVAITNLNKGNTIV